MNTPFNGDMVALRARRPLPPRETVIPVRRDDPDPESAVSPPRGCPTPL